MKSTVCVWKRRRRVIVHISWSQWCLRPIKFDSHQNLLCTLETSQLCTAHYRHIPMVPTKDFKPFIYAGMFVPICIPSKRCNLWDLLSDKECALLIPLPNWWGPSHISFLKIVFFIFYAPSCTFVQVPGGVGFICRGTHVLHVSLLFLSSCQSG